MRYLIIFRCFSEWTEKQPLAKILQVFQYTENQHIIYLAGDDRIPHILLYSSK